MKIAIIGASGAIGSAVTDYLLERTKHQLVLFSHHARQLEFPRQYHNRITEIDGSVLNAKAITAALQNCETAVYLVHLMGNKAVGKQFSSDEAKAATNFANAAAAQNVKRVIYVGGMGGEEGAKLTQHLQSRQATGKIIRSKVRQLIEFRTPMVVGPDCAGFEVLSSIVTKLHVLPVPSWARAVTQPIALQDVVRYVVAALNLQSDEHQSVEIGGPEQLSYVDVAKRYARHQHKRLITVPLPLVTQSMAAVAMRVFKSPHARTVSDMIASAGYSTVVEGDEAKQLFPEVVPVPIEQAF